MELCTRDVVCTLAYKWCQGKSKKPIYACSIATITIPNKINTCFSICILTSFKFSCVKCVLFGFFSIIIYNTFKNLNITAWKDLVLIYLFSVS